MPLVLLDGRGLAQRLGVRYEDVMSWARVGKIPSVKTGRGRVFFNLDLVIDALRESADSVAEGRLAVAGASSN